MNRLEPAQTQPFGLTAWLEQTKVTLPLKGVECRFEVTAGVASVELDQIYHQNHAEPLDCTYTFPLPADAAIYRCELPELSKRRSATVILITDGQVGNEEQIVRHFRCKPAVAVHTFGIDTVVNDAFFKQLARQQGGGCWLQTPNDDIAGTVAGLADRLRRPVLTALKIGPNWQPAAARLPNLHAGQIVELSLRGTGPLKISGRLAGGGRHVFAPEPALSENPALKLLWARQRIEALLAAQQTGAALALARQCNLLCEGAAFIAWDEAEQAQVAQREIYQPSQEADIVDAFRSPTRFAMRFALGPADQSKSVNPLLSPRYFATSEGENLWRAKMRKELRRYLFGKADRLGIEVELMALNLDPTLASLLAAWVDEMPRWPGYRRRVIARLIERLSIRPFELAGVVREFINKHFAGDDALHAALLAMAPPEPEPPFSHALARHSP